MKLNEEKATEILSKNLLSYFDILDYKSILQFAVQDVNLAADISSPKAKVDLQNAPHIVEPLAAAVIEKNKRKKVVCAMPQQMGKKSRLCHAIADGEKPNSYVEYALQLRI